MSESWQLWDWVRNDSAWNMAADERLLATVAEANKPVLRFYAWMEEAASFGYFQHYAEVEQMTPLRPLIRRPTGGGLVPHVNDWTYSLVFPPTHFWYQLRAQESYRLLHEWVRDAFRWVGVETELSPCCAKDLPGQCFAGPEKSDLLWMGQKIAGAAQRRAKHGLLIQGSVQHQPKGVVRRDWAQGMVEVARKRWGVEWSPFDASGYWNTEAEWLRMRKYCKDEYNRKR